MGWTQTSMVLIDTTAPVAKYTTSHGATHKHFLLGLVHYINAQTDEQALTCANNRFAKPITLFDMFRLNKSDGKYRWVRCADERKII